MIEILTQFTAITDPAANIAIIGLAVVGLKIYIEQKLQRAELNRHCKRLSDLEGKVFKA